MGYRRDTRKPTTLLPRKPTWHSSHFTPLPRCRQEKLGLWARVQAQRYQLSENASQLLVVDEKYFNSRIFS
jgi:hypothetical protein